MGAPNLSGCVADSEDCKTPLPEDEAAQKEYWNIVRSALTPSEFSAVSMYFRESLTQEDIAERLGKTQPAVFKSIRKAIGKLRRPSIVRRLAASAPDPRKASATGHRAIHAYQVAYAPGESPKDRAAAETERRDVAIDERKKEQFRDAWWEYLRPLDD